MAEQTQPRNNQQTLVIVLVVVAVLLAAVIGVLMYQNSQGGQTASQTPATTGQTQGTVQTPAGQMPPAGGTGSTSGGTSGGASGGMMGGGSAAFDPKTATQVTKGETPEQWVKAYYEATDKGDYEAAIAKLPADKKAQTTPSSLKEQLAGYGITGFKIINVNEQGDTTTVVVDQTTKQFGTFENTWTFVKGDNGTWLVKSKAVTGMK